MVREKEKRIEKEKEEQIEEVEGTSDKPDKEGTSRKESGEEQIKEEPPKVSLPAPYPLTRI